MNWVIFSWTGNVVVEGQVADHRMKFVGRDGLATVTGSFRYTCVECGTEISGDYKHCYSEVS